MQYVHLVNPLAGDGKNFTVSITSVHLWEGKMNEGFLNLGDKLSSFSTVAGKMKTKRQPNRDSWRHLLNVV